MQVTETIKEEFNTYRLIYTDCLRRKKMNSKMYRKQIISLKNKQILRDNPVQNKQIKFNCGHNQNTVEKNETKIYKIYFESMSTEIENMLKCPWHEHLNILYWKVSHTNCTAARFISRATFKDRHVAHAAQHLFWVSKNMTKVHYFGRNPEPVPSYQ